MFLFLFLFFSVKIPLSLGLVVLVIIQVEAARLVLIDTLPVILLVILGSLFEGIPEYRLAARHL